MVTGGGQGVGEEILHALSRQGARVGHYGSSVYSAVKAGGEALMRTLSKELGSKGITANAVVLGLINTVPPEFSEGLERFYSTRRIGTPEDIAAAVVYLGSEEAAWKGVVAIGRVTRWRFTTPI